MEFSRLWDSSETDQGAHEWAENRLGEVLNRDSVMATLDDREGEIPPELPWTKEQAEDAAMLLLRAGRTDPPMRTREQAEIDPGEKLLQMTEILLGPIDYLSGTRV